MLLVPKIQNCLTGSSMDPFLRSIFSKRDSTEIICRWPQKKWSLEHQATFSRRIFFLLTHFSWRYDIRTCRSTRFSNESEFVWNVSKAKFASMALCIGWNSASEVSGVHTNEILRSLDRCQARRAERNQSAGFKSLSGVSRLWKLEARTVEN